MRIIGMCVVLVLLGFAEGLFAAEAVADQNPAIDQESRTWTGRNGKFSTEAALQKFADGKVLLKKSGGPIVVVLLDELSDDDQAYVRQRTKAAASSQPSSEGQPPANADKPQDSDDAPIGKSARVERRKEFLFDDYFRELLEFRQRLTCKAYQKIGNRSPRWDAQVLKFLALMAEHDCWRFAPRAYKKKSPMREDAMVSAQAAVEAGCDDPFVRLMWIRSLDWKDWTSADQAQAYEMLYDVPRRGYSPFLVIDLSEVLALIERAKKFDRPRAAGDVDNFVEDMLLASVCQKEYPRLDRRFVLATLLVYSEPMGARFERFMNRLEDSRDADPWLKKMLLVRRERLRLSGEVARGEAIAENDNLKQRWLNAVAQVNEAWKLHPEFPEAPTLMLSLLSLPGDLPGDPPELWFDRAKAAQLDYWPAYEAMRGWILDKRGQQAYRDFAVECLNTRRFDTLIPHNYLDCLWSQALRSIDDETLVEPETLRRARQFFDGFAKYPDRWDLAFLASFDAVFSYRAERYEDALKALQRAGDALDRQVFIKVKIDVDWAVSEIYAKGGPLRSRAETAASLADNGKKLEASQMCQKIADGLRPDDKARRYFRSRAQAYAIEHRFDKGDWVSLQPGEDLAGFSVISGQWSVDKQGRLIGKSDPANPMPMLLACQAHLGDKFEIVGHAEMSDPAGAFGVVISYRNAQSHWACFFYPATGPKRSHAVVRCAAHQNPHERAVAVAKSDDFSVRVYEGKVATTAGAEIGRKTVPLLITLDHDAHEGELGYGIGGITKGDGGTCFTGLKVRKLTAPPEHFQVPLPE